MPASDAPPPLLPPHLTRITGVRLPHKPHATQWDIGIQHGRIASVEPHSSAATAAAAAQASSPSPSVLHGQDRLLLPSLCHAHIHLDKCFLLQDPKYSDLQLQSGDFDEAMALTSKAKSRFDQDDLIRRGRQLIMESIRHGVTAMRAFVEVDHVVHLKCLDAALKLKAEFEHVCHVQLCAFAQLPLFSGDHGGAKVRQLMQTAASNPRVQVLGSTPYVEDDHNKAKQNVVWITHMALEHNKHLDLHLDYFLHTKPPLIWDALDIFREQQWTKHTEKRIALGHCTRWTRFRDEEWAHLSQQLASLPISLIGLPSSDLFIMKSTDNVRGTLPLTRLINELDLNAAIGINNVGNAFTPQGNCDPLSLAQLGVGLYHAGTVRDTELLYVSRWSLSMPSLLTVIALQEAVSARAKAAIGYQPTSFALEVGQSADFVLFDRKDSGWRCRKSISEVVYDAGHSRLTVFRGRVTASTDEPHKQHLAI
jgi:cytosine/adenosine deaminase-related metal-dependent hydrolase